MIQNLCLRRIEGDEFTRQEPWTFPELSRTFQSLTEDGTLDACVCIFVDGLDEYDGTPADVIKILKELASYPNFKLCVSSRPWPIFQKEFGQGIEQLRMEDLTRSDIENHVKGRLSEDHFCRQILGDNLEYEFGIVGRITKSAGGVFLWVRYVVNMLLRETANELTVSDLKNLVWRYPRGLDSLYERMLQMALESYPQEAAELLQVFMKFNRYTCALVPFFIELQRASEKEMDWQTEAKYTCLPKIEARLKARCMDFVEVRPWMFWEEQETSDQTRLPVPFRYEVAFAHRSALEFLDQKSAWLREKAAPGFDVNQSFWKAQLACMKALPHDGEDSGVRITTSRLFIYGVIMLESHELNSGEMHYKEIYQIFKTLVIQLKV